MATPARRDDEQDSRRDERREREEMFTIAPELLAGGALPRRSDGAPYRALEPADSAERAG